MKAPTLALLLSLETLWCCSCATSTAGLSKDQITEQQRQRSAWADFGRSVLTIAVNAGVASLGNGPSTDGFRK